MFCRNLSFAATAITCLILVGCATVQETVPEEIPAITEPAGWAAEQQTRQQIKTWEIRGRLGVQTETTGGSMDIIWKQSDSDFSIRLIAPLGAGNYLIQGDDRFVEIHFPDGHTEYIDDLDNVFASVLGIDLPASALKDWIRGLPATSLPIDSIKWNEKGLLYKTEQSGWHVEMNQYAGNHLLLPHTLYLAHEDDTALDVRLALRQWLLD